MGQDLSKCACDLNLRKESLWSFSSSSTLDLLLNILFISFDVINAKYESKSTARARHMNTWVLMTCLKSGYPSGSSDCSATFCFSLLFTSLLFPLWWINTYPIKALMKNAEYMYFKMVLARSPLPNTLPTAAFINRTPIAKRHPTLMKNHTPKLHVCTTLPLGP